jgi:hypothetical protein
MPNVNLKSPDWLRQMIRSYRVDYLLTSAFVSLLLFLPKVGEKGLSKAKSSYRLNPRNFWVLPPSPKFLSDWVNLGAPWAQNPPFSCPNKVFEECKAN